MKPPLAFWIMIMAVLMALLAANFTRVEAQSGGYDLTWNTVDGGGRVSTGEGFEVSGTIGQERNSKQNPP